MAAFCSFWPSVVKSLSLHYLNNNDFDYSPSESYPTVVTVLGETFQNGDD